MTENTEKAAAPLDFTVSVRPIEPKGNLLAFASVCFGNSFVVDDFKVLQSEKSLFVGMPSKPDRSSASGYRDTAKPITAEFRATLTGAVVAAYHAAIEKLQNRAAVEAPAAEKPSIKEQLEAGAKQAAEETSEQTAPAKRKKAAKEER